MMSRLIQLSNIVEGEERVRKLDIAEAMAIQHSTNPIHTHTATRWTIEAAKETATRTQHKLSTLPIKVIYRLLERAMDYYLVDEEDYNFISDHTGNPIDFVCEGLCFINNWCRDLQPFYEQCLKQESVYIKNSAPVVVVLPSNSDQEVGYVLAQTLLSRNATIVRPSSQGASAYATVAFVKAFNRAVDEESDPSLEFLKGAISVIHTGTDYLKQLSVTGWNYIFFGSDQTIQKIRDKLYGYCTPRTLIGYGTGLSTSVVLEDADLEDAVEKVLQSITINTGNECVSTDIVYIHEAVYDSAVTQLNQQAKQIRVGDPLQRENIGCGMAANEAFIEQQLVQVRGKTLNRRGGHIAPTLVALHDYETTLEYPGPIASIRKFTSQNHLAHLISRDLRDNEKSKNLVTSVFTQSTEQFKQLLPHLKAYMVKHNKATHDFNISKPHQGVMILEELVERVYLD